MEIFGLNVPTWLVVAVPTTYLLYRYLMQGYDVFKNQGIPGPRAFPLVGTSLGFFSLGILKYDVGLRQKYGKMIGTFLGSTPLLFVCDPQLVKQVMVKDFSLFQNRRGLDYIEYPLDKMLTVLRDDHWKHVRALFTPNFSGSRLRRMTDAINKNAVNLRDHLVAALEKGACFDIKACAGNFTMDAIASTAFGIELDSQKDPNNQFVAMGKKAFSRNLKDPRMLLLVFAPKLAAFLGRRFGMTIFPADVTSFFTKVTNDVMKHREEHPEIQAKDFMQLMVSSRIDDPETQGPPQEGAGDDDLVFDKSGVWSKSKLTHGEILAQALIFFLAGYETTALTLSYVAYNLALFPEKQAKLLKEIDRVTEGKDEVDYGMCKQMTYLGMCIDESTRMYPAAPRLDREASEDTTLDGFRVPKGMIVSFGVYAMHRDPELWEDPDNFIPERFTAEAKAARDPYSFLPFGHGPRNCIGMRLALMEIQIALATILKTHRFVTCDETEIPVKTKAIGVTPCNGIKLKLEVRK